MRICVDTNIIISALLFPTGKTAEVFSHIIENHNLIICTYAINECKTVFNKKFPEKQQYLEKFLSELDFELFTTPDIINQEIYPAIRDPLDLPILVSAILSDSDILITGDKDFEDIKIDKPLIFTPSRYFDLLNNKGT
ncbi:MAG TPA: putative toxin-antitoxin system toxin component, PIN family [Treponema sp.]|nr:putative toxin-antitoxin system toxin component, PIN family [Treponema sp.]HKL86568.1 putative toxin-antitoxin system toxin component, PIN family [Treponemataceae bacterium]